jgi:hypothetical protein
MYRTGILVQRPGGLAFPAWIQAGLADARTLRQPYEDEPRPSHPDQEGTSPPQPASCSLPSGKKIIEGEGYRNGPNSSLVLARKPRRSRPERYCIRSADGRSSWISGVAS